MQSLQRSYVITEERIRYMAAVTMSLGSGD